MTNITTLSGWNPHGTDTKRLKVSCWENHPVYFINDMPIVGGSCTSNYPDVDVFIALDWNGKKGKRSYPWNKGVDIYFKITDMGVPEDTVEFIKLLSYTAKAMKSGKKVYVGCIGGHGRTGLFLAALTTLMSGEKDSITKVRAEYCKKAVESDKQMKWLHDNFEIVEVEPSKAIKKKKQPKKKKFDPWANHNNQSDLWVEGNVNEGKPETYMFTTGSKIVINND